MENNHEECLLTSPPRGIIDIQNLFKYNDKDNVTSITLNILSQTNIALYSVIITQDKFRILKQNTVIINSQDPNCLICKNNKEGQTGLYRFWIKFSAQGNSSKKQISFGYGQYQDQAPLGKYEEPDNQYFESAIQASWPQLKPIKISFQPIELYLGPKIWTGPDNQYPGLTDRSFISPNLLNKENRFLYELMKNFSLEKVFNDQNIGNLIHSSIITQGHFLNKKLKNKYDRQWETGQTCYLRFSIYNDTNLAPTNMFIIEIWPPQCQSAIHDHAGTNGVVKVIQGEIFNLTYPFLSNCPRGSTPLEEIKFKKNDTLYFTPIRNQVHQIQNQGNWTAVTIQAYRRNDDLSHFQETFDYIEEQEKNIKRFTPKCDFQIDGNYLPLRQFHEFLLADQLQEDHFNALRFLKVINQAPQTIRISFNGVDYVNQDKNSEVQYQRGYYLQVKIMNPLNSNISTDETVQSDVQSITIDEKLQIICMNQESTLYSQQESQESFPWQLQQQWNPLK